MNKRRHAFLALALSTGCAQSIGNPEPVTQRAALESFSGPNACADLETYIEDTAVKMMRSQLEQQRDSLGRDYYYEPRVGLAEGDVATASPAAPAENAAQASDSAGSSSSSSGGETKSSPTDYTTTNNQVEGVDEADFVKNDGTRIFVLSGQTLHAVKSWPANEAAVIGTVKIDGWPRELFLEGNDKAVVFSQVWKSYPLADRAAGDCEALSMSCGYYYSNTIKVSVVDVSDMAQMKVVSEYELPGSYNSARKIGSAVRLVLNDDFRFPQGVQWYPEYTYYPGMYDANGRPTAAFVADMKAKYDALIVQNEKLIREQSLAAWLPASTLKEQGNTEALAFDCTDFAKVNAPTRMGIVTVATLNLEQKTLDQQSILAEPGQIYASLSNLYIATTHWWWRWEIGQENATYLHKFDISSPTQATYVASGTVPGYIVDQFSMDEHKGFFRIVTTIDTRVADTQNPQNQWGRIETTNGLFVFGEDAGALKVVGKVDGLAKGERVQSSRFLGDKGFVVTFRQVDPLFSFDLTDPTNPIKKGELKIPGFSTYMHPLDDTHLLTIGQYIPEPGPNGQTDWSKRGLQLQIFDISDLTAPKLAHSTIVGNNSSYSEAMWEHKAFNYFPAKKLLAIPFTSWDYSNTGASYWSTFTSELRVLSVDADTGFTAKGAISLNDLYQQENYYGWTYYWTPSVRRSVMADEFVYAISDAGVRVSNIANLSTPVATATFERTTEVK